MGARAKLIGKWLGNYEGGRESEWLPANDDGISKMCEDVYLHIKRYRPQWVQAHQLQIRELLQRALNAEQTAYAALTVLRQLRWFVVSLRGMELREWLNVYEAALGIKGYPEVVEELRDDLNAIERFFAPRASVSVGSDEPTQPPMPPPSHVGISGYATPKWLMAQLKMRREHLRNTNDQPTIRWIYDVLALTEWMPANGWVMIAHAYHIAMLAHYMRRELDDGIRFAEYARDCFSAMTLRERNQTMDIRFENHLVMSTLYRMKGWFDEAKHELRLATQSADSGGFHINELIALGSLHYSQRDFQQAFTAYQAGAALIAQHPTPDHVSYKEQRLRVQMGMGMTLRRLGDYPTSDECLTDSRAMCQAVKDVLLEGFNELQVAILRAYEYRRADAFAMLRRAEALSHEVKSAESRQWLLRLTHQVAERLHSGQLGPGEYTE